MTVADTAQIIANAATFFALTIAVISYITENRRRRMEREYGTYNALDDKYIEYLRLTMENPEFDTYSLDDFSHFESADRDTRVKIMAMFQIMISLCERAFLMYSDQGSKIKLSQWSGWKAYIMHWSTKPGFKRLWPEIGSQFDEDFVAFVEKHRAK